MKKIKNVKKDIELFKEWFKNKYNIVPKVLFVFPSSKPRHTPEILRDIINEVMLRYPHEFNTENSKIDIKNRDPQVVLYRNIYFYIGHEWGHTYSALGNALQCKKHHSTGIYAVKKVEDLIKRGDKITINKLNIVINDIEKKLGAYGDVPQNHDQEFDSKSILSPVLFKRKYSKSANKFASRHEGSNTDWIC